MTVIVPADYHDTLKATKAVAEVYGPCYIRFGRAPMPVVTILPPVSTSPPPPTNASPCKKCSDRPSYSTGMPKPSENVDSMPVRPSESIIGPTPRRADDAPQAERHHNAEHRKNPDHARDRAQPRRITDRDYPGACGSVNDFAIREVIDSGARIRHAVRVPDLSPEVNHFPV